MYIYICTYTYIYDVTHIRCYTCNTLPTTDILAVNSRLLSDSGGPCECAEALKDVPDCVFFDPEYLGYPRASETRNYKGVSRSLPHGALQ